MQGEPKLTDRGDATVIATDDFTLLKVPPPQALNGLVLEIALYEERSGRPVHQLEPASLAIPLLIGFSDPFSIALDRQPGSDDNYLSFTSGLCLTPAIIRSAGRCSCVQVMFTPPGARRFFGLPMEEIAHRIVPLADLDDAPLRQLRSRLSSEANWDLRLVMIEDFLTRRLRAPTQERDAIAFAYQRIVSSGGRVTVTKLAEAVNLSRKHLAARFRDEIGLPPKAVARIARFTRAQGLARIGDTEWAGIAADCGYVDQAHLTREFREFAGTTPQRWKEREATG